MPGEVATRSWTLPQRIAFRFFVLFVVLFIISFPFPHEYIPDVGELTRPFWEGLIEFSANTFYSLPDHAALILISDSRGLYIHVVNLLVISTLGCAVWSYLDRRRMHYQQLAYWFTVLISYYLAMQLMCYGFNKVFKAQFYLPEPNTLFTAVGNTPKDLLYWSSMGSSWSYNFFMGMTEVIAAFFLLFRKTRLIGAISCIAIMLNVVAVNIGFDISVKVYSTFLLLLSLLIVAPHTKRLYRFFVKNESTRLERWQPFLDTKRKQVLYAAGKAMIICWLLFDALLFYFQTGNFNDDLQPRPPMHGAYQVFNFYAAPDNGQTYLQSEVWKRVFVHRDGYFIHQTLNEQMHDYELQMDLDNNMWLVTDYQLDTTFSFNVVPVADSIWTVTGRLHHSYYSMQIKQLEISNMPLLQNEFRWFVED